MISLNRLFGTNGIRGLVNKELTSAMVIKIGYAVGTFFEKGNLILGFDARTSSPMLVEAVVSGLNATGCNVQSVGMVPTPALQYAVRRHRPEGAVMVTASHNPPEYNGIKVIWKDGIEISREQEVEIEGLYFQEKTDFANWNELGKTCELPGIIEEYLMGIKENTNEEKIIERKFHVVIDAGNSVGALAAPSLLRDLGCRVTTINANIDGTFPGRMPEPRPENLQELALTVRAVGADFGVAYDGDADRSVFVDEKGSILTGDETFALVEKEFLKQNRGEKVVTPVSSSTVVKEIADEFGGKLVWTKVGSVTVSQTMKKLKAKLGGEENGGIFYGPHQPVRDGAMSTALMLNIMASTGKKLSVLIGELPKYYIQKAKIECPNELKMKALEKVAESTKALNTNTLDGIKLGFDDKSGILIRPSGTEPTYRLYAEAKTRERAMKLIKEYTLKLQRIISSLR